MRRLRIAILALVLSTLLVLTLPVDQMGLAQLSDPNYSTVSTLVINKLRGDLLPAGVELLPLDWFSPFTTYLHVSLFIGILISSPIIIHQIYRFIDPALYDNERRLLLLFAGAFSLLFMFGVALGYLVIVPTTFRVLLGLTYMLGMVPRYEFSSFFGIVLGGLFMAGIFFTFPVFFVTLVRAGVVKTSIVTRARKFIYLGAFVAICIVTPDPTIISDLILFVPLIVLLEASVLVGKRIERDRARKKMAPALTI